MKQWMEYKIVSGKTVETKRSLLSVRSKMEPKPRRAPRVAGNSSEKKIKANEKSSALELARGMNSTMKPGDVHFSLKYDDDAHLPGRDAEHPLGTYEAGKAAMKKFLDEVRRAFKKEFGRNPKMFWVTGNWSTKYKKPARIHQHLVIERDALTIVINLWGRVASPEADWITFLDSSGDYSNLAAYLVDNVHNVPPNTRKWHASRNVSRPTYTEPVPVDDVEGIQPEKNSVVKDYVASVDEDGRVISTYMRCVLPVAPKVRGGKLIIPRTEKRGGKKRE